MNKIQSLIASFRDKPDLAVMIIIGAVSIGVIVLDMLGILPQNFKLPNYLSLVLLSTIALYLIIERRDYFLIGQKKLEEGQNLGLSGQSELTILVKALQKENSNNTQEIIHAIGAKKEEKIILAAPKRSQTPSKIFEQKFSAEKVDIIGVTLNHAIEELNGEGGKKIIENLLFHNLQLRLFIVHPHSEYLKQRAVEDKDDYCNLVKRQVAAVNELVKFYELLKVRYEDEKLTKGRLDTRAAGTLHIKLLDFCPYISVFRADDKIYWGLYTSGSLGLNMPLFLTTMERDSSLYTQLEDHIDRMMDCDMKYPDLIKMTNVDEPFLNMDVYKSATC